MGEKNRLLYLILIMVFAVVLVGGFTFRTLYWKSINNQREWLLNTAQSQARLIESVAKFDAEFSTEDHLEGAFAATLSQIINAHQEYKGFGKTGEFTLAKRVDDKIIFLLSHRHYDMDKPKPVPFHADLAEPMERALAGKSGTMIGLDYRGVQVLAAHEPVAFLNLGIVAKIDIEEIRNPFIIAAIKSGAIAIVLISIGSLFFMRITNPIIKKLRQNKDSLDKAQEIAHLGNWDYNILTKELIWSDEIYRIFGIDPMEFGGAYEDFLNLVHPDDLEYVKSSMDKAMNREYDYNIEFMIVRPDNTMRTVHAQGEVTWNATGSPIRMVGTVQDITERKRNEKILLENEEKYRMLVNSTKAIPWIFDSLTWQFTFVGAYAKTLFGYRIEEWYQENFWQDHIHPDDREEAVNYCKAAIQRLEDHEFEYRMITSNGKIIWIYDIVKATHSSGKSIQVHGIMIDITERKKIEEELRILNESLEQRVAERTAELAKANEELVKIDKLESIGTLAGGIAHDFSNSLQGILGNITLAKTYANPKDEIYGKLVGAEEIALHARNLPKQLLTFSRGGAPVKKTISIPELINNSANLALSGSNTRCEVHMPKDLMPVEADSNQIIQVISNLIINANHAMPKGGTIKVSAENTNVEATSSLPLKEGKYVRISIEDQGMGISQEHLQKIFDPFFTTKQKGSGLGLATAYSIIKKHNGHISVESTMEVGTTFHIYLPASGKKAVEKPVLSKVKEKDMKKMPTIGQGKVLLMDDEDVIRDVISEHLKRLGYEAETAEDGSAAIELYKRAMESGKPFDAVIMDLTIPGTIGGEEVIKKLLKIDHKVKAIVSSGYADNPIMSNFRKYGFSGVIAKPYEIHELNEVLQEVINAEN